MDFVTEISPARLRSIRKRLRAGLIVWRGIGHKPADPGDLGRGTYYSSKRMRAANYGQATRHSIVLLNPLILTREESYTQIADRFGTISGIAGQPKRSWQI